MSLLASGKVSESGGGGEGNTILVPFLSYLLGKREYQEQHAWGCVSLQFCVVSDGASDTVNSI